MAEEFREKAFVLVNKMESVVRLTVDEIFKQYPKACSCERCRLDVLALSLNLLPPKYVVTSFGDIMTNVELDLRQWKVDVMMVVIKAVNLVAGKPRHP